MMSASLWVPTIAVALGVVLALWHLRAAETGRRPPIWLGLLHGGVGLASLVILGLVLRGPVRGVATGVGGFGLIAAWLFGAALPTGLLVWTRRRQGPALSLTVHAGFGIAGWMLLLAWNALG